MGFFTRNLFSRSKSEKSASSSSSPPPYQELPSSNSQPGNIALSPIPLNHLGRPNPNIKATDTPQWLWTPSECRKWIETVHLVFFETTPEEAKMAADKFVGCGSTFYSHNLQYWISAYGKQRGNDIWRMILCVYRDKGAVPSTIKFGHFKYGGSYPVQKK